MYFDEYQCPFLDNYDYEHRENEDLYRQAPRRAVATIVGGPLAPNIRGTVTFTSVPNGTEVSVVLNGLPPYRPAMGGRPQVGPHGFHIHQNGNCTPGTAAQPFPGTGEHWNPTNQPHGNHAGDFPVVFSNNGYARMTFFTNKFRVPQVIGKSVVLHESPDDYRTQPAGASGRKVACGVIRAVR
ncbi:Cu-Zn family superoxide dismutase [Clostridium acetobutylicum]|uniref:Superoxide dismutase, Cu-Zn family n=1 Tax=Clostridium acetobutylicum (strain ATCC 824 / DSM 792 / JCM 1419 / IAM 19013 / LMG 5710 / NBRC 13948 / NRRL B-527 / VKM B-1787 / 2291 / W) TaxID=272562 RepID=Q97JC3_CLOAB|nr:MULTISPECIES: superoxide dismutase family protein [Clostridium]AAK79331.1 Superoxide dismutase, Cu-Zn family [Clostridium acetobutylicum ATCC 824]ADZ20414.1 Superoxide dismutase, Cu-Zn family [Clostridium acetobutylicum EA 2018]AEI33714.1 Cu/Zn family superoxide dismutase [Clostridium acetobutylicum DSM 1731]AWV81419.1 superoxide dismutase family protein [Clostridium acetobutylicum]MBC2393055.1 superoxide dismutase family protein [Clostridium acetobutylicum]